MIHELLLALSGNSGARFQFQCSKTRPSASGSTSSSSSACARHQEDELILVENVNFSHPSEHEIVAKLCALGSQYLKFTSFISENGACKLVGEKRLVLSTRSLYLAAFCEGLNSFLDSYRKEITEIERTAQTANEMSIGLFSIHGKLQPFELIFESLSEFINESSRSQPKGCEIISLVASRAQHAALRPAYELILESCHKVLCLQLTSWLCEGEVSGDPYAEFFIQKRTETESVQSQSEYYLRRHLLPTYLTPEVGDQILFIGESLRLLQSADYRENFPDSDFLSSFLDRVSSNLHAIFCAGPGEFEPARLMLCIEVLKEDVCGRMWGLVVEESKLTEELEKLTNFYFLGRGELFLSFLDLGEQSLDKNDLGKATKSAEINRILKLAAETLYLDSEEILRGIALSIAETGSETKKVGPKSCWDQISIDYVIPWPLDLVITKEMLEKMNEIFRFLLKIRRVKLRLGQVWKEMRLAEQDSEDSESNSDVSLRIWQLRSSIAHGIDALQYYLGVEVLTGSFQQLRKKLENMGQEKHPNFLECKTEIESFVLKVYRRSCLESEFLRIEIENILAICNEFCDIILDVGTSDVWGSLGAKVQELYVRYQRQSSLFYRMLVKISRQEKTAGLDQLVLELDYNSYFSRDLL